MKFVANIACTLIAFTANATEPPNFLIIYADDLGYTQTSVPMMKDRPKLAHELHQTPSLEKLAKRACDFQVRIVLQVCLHHARHPVGKTTARVGCISLHDVVMNKKQIDLGKTCRLQKCSKRLIKATTAFFGKGCTPMHWFKDHGYDVTDFHHKHPNGNAHGDCEQSTKLQSLMMTPSVSSVWRNC